MAIDRRIVELYDEYTHKPLDRRVFMERLLALAGTMGAATAALAALEPNQALAQQVSDADPRIRSEMLSVSVGAVPISGYLVRPAQAGRYPAVIVIHENRGLNAHISDVTRRFALSGFVAFAPDMLLPSGGTPQDPDAARAAIGALKPDDAMRQARAAIAFLAGDPGTNGKVGAAGFCWGGGLVNQLATRDPDLDAGVVFYGVAPALDSVAAIKAPLLLHHASLDTRVNAGLPAYEAALKAAGVRYTLHLYEGVNHAFHNDTSAERYDRAAATLAYDRTVVFLKEALGG